MAHKKVSHSRKYKLMSMLSVYIFLGYLSGCGGGNYDGSPISSKSSPLISSNHARVEPLGGSTDSIEYQIAYARDIHEKNSKALDFLYRKNGIDYRYEDNSLRSTQVVFSLEEYPKIDEEALSKSMQAETDQLLKLLTHREGPLLGKAGKRLSDRILQVVVETTELETLGLNQEKEFEIAITNAKLIAAFEEHIEEELGIQEIFEYNFSIDQTIYPTLNSSKSVSVRSYNSHGAGLKVDKSKKQTTAGYYLEGKEHGSANLNLSLHIKLLLGTKENTHEVNLDVVKKKWTIAVSGPTEYSFINDIIQKYNLDYRSIGTAVITAGILAFGGLLLGLSTFLLKRAIPQNSKFLYINAASGSVSIEKRKEQAIGKASGVEVATWTKLGQVLPRELFSIR